MESRTMNPGSAREPEQNPNRLAEERRRRLIRVGEGVALALAAVALAVLIASCSQNDPQASTGGETSPKAEQVAEAAATPGGLNAGVGKPQTLPSGIPTVTAA